MKRCILCRRHNRHFERITYDWEVDHSNEYDVWQAEAPEALELVARADAISESAPEEAVEILAQAAGKGSVVATYKLAWHHSTGTGTPKDMRKALDFYRAALEGGSWMAMIDYARLCAAFGDDEEAERMYLDGIDANFLPANYWMAQHLYNRAPTRKTALRIKPWLDKVVDGGHPRATIFQVRLYLRGKYGLRSIPRWIRLAMKSYGEFAPTSEQLEQYS